jgi:hypothetical protein
MKFRLSILLIPLFASCALNQGAKKEVFVAAPNSIDERIETASIEDYIIALPPYAYHEASVDQFVEQVRRVRVDQEENHSKGPNYLFVNGDGCWPSKDFVLDRERRSLKIRVYQWEPGMKDYTETMRRVPGGWMRGPQIEVKTAEQAGASNGG